MKGCFLLQRRFAYLGHVIAQNLQEKYGVNEFCAYVQQRSSFDWLKSQQEIKYSTLLLDEDVHNLYKNEKIDIDYLNFLEKEYGIPNLWPYLTVDRVLMSNQLVREYPYDKSPYTHEELIKLLQVHARAIISMLEKEKPNFIFASVVGSLGNLLFYHIAKKMGIKTLITLPTCTEKGYLISEKFDCFTNVEKLFKQYTTNNSRTVEAEKFLNEFRQKPLSYSSAIDNIYLKKTNRSNHFQFLMPKNLWRSVKWYGEVLKEYHKQKKFNDYSFEMHPWYYIVDHLKRKVRNAIGASDLYDEFLPTEPFVFFPLHYEPEIALLLHASYYTDQINLIKHIARSLPINYKLYVKEHPAMVPYRPRKFYKELKKIPNVKLINPAISSFSIIPHAKLITVITGTVGWEASLLKKPVISFGEQFYNSLPQVKKCENIKDLPKIVKEQLQNFKHNEEDLLKFLQAIIDSSVSVDMMHFWENEGKIENKKEGMKPLTDLLAKELNLTKI